MRPSQSTISLSIFSVVLILGLVATTAQADDAKVKWERIKGVIVPGSVLGGFNVVGGVDSLGFSFTTEKGNAKLNLATGRLRFDVEGVMLAGTPGTNVIGTRGSATQTVKGTVVCNASSGPVVLVDTPPVPLSFQGDAEFDGIVDLPAVCEDTAFLIRVADPTIGLFNKWFAYGAVRRP